MKLIDAFEINVRYQRSTRIDSDLNPDFFPGLVFHGTAEQTFRTIIKQYTEAKQKVFTLTGAYGTGKSTIALLFNGLMHTNSAIRNSAKNVIANPELVVEFNRAFSIEYEGDAWLLIRAVGGITDPVESIWQAVKNAILEHHWGENFLRQFRDPKGEDELVENIESISYRLKGKVAGVALFLDEMGKVLEHMSKNNRDLHLFQDLSERLSRVSSEGVPTLMIGMLHQSISAYALNQSLEMQKEWAKVQGRFSDLKYSVSPDETIALLDKTIIVKTDLNDKLQKVIDNTAADTVRSIKLSAMKVQDSRSLAIRLAGCYPLHPSAALILGPISKRPFSQNERSTFSFLNTREPESFQSFLAGHKVGEFYRLSELWDFLEANLEHQIISSSDGHLWATAEDALTRTRRKNETTDAHLSILKGISIVNIFGKKAGLYASTEFLVAAFGITKEEIEGILADLAAWSIIIKRIHLGSWAIFEGADINIVELLEEKLETIKLDDSWLDQIGYNSYSVAKAHYHKTGVMRWANLQIVREPSVVEGTKTHSSKAFTTFSLIMSNYPDDYDSIADLSKVVSQNHHVIALCKDFETIRSLALDVYALNTLEHDIPEIQTDNIARKELELRRGEAKYKLHQALEASFNNASWWYQGKELAAKQLSVMTSQIADELYSKAPLIINELVGRSKLSATSVSARRKLMIAMLENGLEDNLAIEGFPPEKSIYLSCVRNLGLHMRNEDGLFTYHYPKEENLRLAFSSIDTALEESVDYFTLAKLYEIWSAAPFGISEGVRPILALAWVLAKGDNVALFDRDVTQKFIYTPELDEDLLNKFVRFPSEVAFRHVELNSIDKQYIQAMAGIISEQFSREVSEHALAVARPIVTFVHQLPNWVKTTKKLSSKTLAFRDLVLKANDPYVLLLTDFIGFFKVDRKTAANHREWMKTELNSAIDELKGYKPNVIQAFSTLLIRNLGTLDLDLIEKCNYVESSTADFKLRSFAQRISSFSDDNDWVEAIISLATGKPESSWNDVILTNANESIFDYCQRFKRYLVMAKARSKEGLQGETIALIVDSGNKQAEYSISVNPNAITLAAADQASEKIMNILNDLAETKSLDARAIVLNKVLQKLMQSVTSSEKVESND